jgi:hypothetical protein
MRTAQWPVPEIKYEITELINVQTITSDTLCRQEARMLLAFVQRELSESNVPDSTFDFRNRPTDLLP